MAFVNYLLIITLLRLLVLWEWSLDRVRTRFSSTHHINCIWITTWAKVKYDTAFRYTLFSTRYLTTVFTLSQPNCCERLSDAL